MARQFETIDGNYCNPDTICGYCPYHGGCLTRSQMALHNCQMKNGGQPCPRLITFRWRDKKTSQLTGDAYRESLKRKKHHR